MKFNKYTEEYEAAMPDLLGRVFTAITNTDDQIKLYCDEGVFTFRHDQDCCEHVYIESIVGDLSDLVGHPILIAEEAIGERPEDFEVEYANGSETWTFYKLATIKGYVDIRWYGSSNGYYSESVDLYFVENERKENGTKG